MRCKCCDNPLSRADVTIFNKTSGQEEDLCSYCRYLSRHATTEREYVCGAYPVDGVTQPMKSSD